MLPVYRLSEGAENLDRNYKTFDDCLDIFRKNGIVLIFSEGKCINEWNLRPLKKGTARLTLDAWEQHIPLTIIPLGINYSSFTSFGKNLELNFGTGITKENAPFANGDSPGIKIMLFNNALKTQLEKLVAQIKPADKKIVKERFGIRVPAPKKILLFIPAAIGFLLNAPLYLPIQQFSKKKFGKIDHYDSVTVGMLFIFYPVYLLIISVIIFLLAGGYWWLFVLLMPVSAYCYVQVKRQF